MHRVDVLFEMRAARKALGALSVLLAVGVSMSVSLPARAGGRFTDDDGSQFEPYIESAVEEGVLDSCNKPKETKFCPESTVTRAAFARGLFRAVRPAPTDVDYYRDDDGRGVEDALNALAHAGILSGCTGRKFCPDAALNRVDAAAMVVRAFAWDTTAKHPYDDVGKGFAGRALAALGQRGAIESCDPPVGVRLCPSQTLTRGEAARILVMALGLDPEEPGDESAGNEAFRFTDKFSDLALWDDRVPSYRNRVQLTSDGYEGSGLRVTIPRGSHFGADFKLHLGDAVGEEPEHLYFRYFLRLDPDWSPTSSGKLPGFSGVYRSAGKGGFRSEPGAPGWSARVKFSATGQDPRAALGYYVYHLDQAGHYGDSMNWNEAGKLVPGDWYCLEGEIELNSPGAANGVLRAWVDGTPAFETTGLRFRRQGEPGVRIESFWFNVYYGGLSVASSSQGLTVDNVKVGSSRVGCRPGSNTQREASGDVTGDGYPDRVSWVECSEGPCVRLETMEAGGNFVSTSLGSEVWASLETQQTGITLGDLDGDGLADLLYRGRCEKSVPCWRAHLFNGATSDPGQDWGRDSALSSSTRHLFLGDWDGDGRDDLLYAGRCSSDEGSCWTVHLNEGGHFKKGRVWGTVSWDGQEALYVADVSGDGRDDIVYPAVCDNGPCWKSQISKGSGFTNARSIGFRDDSKVAGFADLDGDGRSDLITIDVDRPGTIVVRRSRGDSLGDPRPVDLIRGEITGISLKTAGAGPGSVLVASSCRGRDVCVDRLIAAGTKLVPLNDYVQHLPQAQRLRMADEMSKPPLPRQVKERYFSRLRLAG